MGSEMCIRDRDVGKQIRDLYKEGYDAVGTGNNYPYVLVSLVELEYEVSSQFFF